MTVRTTPLNCRRARWAARHKTPTCPTALLTNPAVTSRSGVAASSPIRLDEISALALGCQWNPRLIVVAANQRFHVGYANWLAAPSWMKRVGFPDPRRSPFGSGRCGP